jgi:hypothetical protein
MYPSESYCDALDRAAYQARAVLARAQIILENDFESFCETDTDGYFCRTVPHAFLRDLFAEKVGFDAFCCKTNKKLVKWLKKTNFSESDKVFIANSMRFSLGLDQ